MALNTRALTLAGALAGTTLVALPVAAAPITFGAHASAAGHSRFDPAHTIAALGCRRNCDWQRHRDWQDDRIDVGDVLVGAVIIGGIAAILSADNRQTRDQDVVQVERDRNPDPRYDERRNDRRAAPRGIGGSGLDNAGDYCRDRIERDVRVDRVEDVERTAAGWRVSGTLFNGSPFVCRIGNSGQIDSIDYGNGFAGALDRAYAPRADGQWSDQRYAEARRAIGAGAMAQPLARAPDAFAAVPARPVITDRMPAYPGGPIPGEVIPETIDRGL